jgi:hypothetical protein
VKLATATENEWESQIFCTAKKALNENDFFCILRLCSDFYFDLRDE